MSLTKWLTAPNELGLTPDRCDLWIADLDGVPNSARAFLSPEELRKAARYVRQEDSQAYANSRGLLRYLLSRYLKVAPAEIIFSYSPHGKPSLGGSLQDSGLRFNLSHSHGKVLMGFALAREIGVDLERIREEAAGEEIAEHYFSPTEKLRLKSLGADQRTRAFFECWTRKEAYLKARGDGLSCPLDSFAVQFGGDAPARLLSANDPGELTRWTWMEVPAGPEFCAAAIIEGQSAVTNRWRFIS